MLPQKKVKLLIYYIIGSILVLYIGYLGFTLYTIDIVNFNPFNMSIVLSISDTIKLAITSYSSDIVCNAEKMYRLESNNFKSGQFTNDFGAGMEAAKTSFPYGWNSLASFWTENPHYSPIGLDSSRVDAQTGKGVIFLKFENFEAGFMTLCEWLEIHGKDTYKICFKRIHWLYLLFDY